LGLPYRREVVGLQEVLGEVREAGRPKIEEMQATIKKSQDNELKLHQGYENYLGGLDVK
jgi:hypothetical protein